MQFRVVVVFALWTPNTRGGVARGIVARPAHNTCGGGVVVLVVVSGLACDAAHDTGVREGACLGIAATGARLAHGAGLAVVVFGASSTGRARLGATRGEAAGTAGVAGGLASAALVRA